MVVILFFGGESISSFINSHAAIPIREQALASINKFVQNVRRRQRLLEDELRFFTPDPCLGDVSRVIEGACGGVSPVDTA